MANFNLKVKKPLERKNLKEALGLLISNPELLEAFIQDPSKTIKTTGLDLTNWEIKHLHEVLSELG